MFTGLRPAELYGLAWADVREQVVKVQRGRDMKSGEEEGTKIRAGVRDLPIHPHLGPLVDAMRSTGNMLRIDNVRDVEQRADLVRAGVTRPELQSGTETLLAFDVRSFRTTFATWCARSRFDSADLDKWLGHKPKTTAAKHYVKDTGAMTSGVFPAVPARFSQRPMARRSRARDPPFAHPVDQAPDSPMITVRRKGLEPLQELPRRNLNPVRLPIPPPSPMPRRAP